MKNIIALTLLALTIACSPHAAETSAPGNEGANGGDWAAQAAAYSANNVLTAVSQAHSAFPEVDYRKLAATIQQTRFISQEHTFAFGTEVDATNNGTDTVWINRTHWSQMVDVRRHDALVFHELLSLMGVEREGYSISSRLLGAHYQFSGRTILICSDSGNREFRIAFRYDTSYDLFAVDRIDISAANTANPFPYRTSAYLKSGNAYELSSATSGENVPLALLVEGGEVKFQSGSRQSSWRCQRALRGDAPQSLDLDFDKFSSCSYSSWQEWMNQECAYRGYPAATFVSCGPISATDFDLKIHCHL